MTVTDFPGEEWRQVPGHPDYDVSDRGRIRSRKRGGLRILNPPRTRDGYPRKRI